MTPNVVMRCILILILIFTLTPTASDFDPGCVLRNDGREGEVEVKAEEKMAISFYSFVSFSSSFFLFSLLSVL